MIIKDFALKKEFYVLLFENMNVFIPLFLLFSFSFDAAKANSCVVFDMEENAPVEDSQASFQLLSAGDVRDDDDDVHVNRIKKLKKKRTKTINKFIDFLYFCRMSKRDDAK